MGRMISGPTGDSQSPDDDADLQPISALNTLLFCERRCALQQIERVWEDNVATMEGTLHHRRTDTGKLEHAPTGRVARAVWLRSARLRLVGRADVVEFFRGVADVETPFPVEYKRGRRRRWDNDDVQLCAQALCLEEMLDTQVPAGAIFHIKSKRRRDVAFTTELRAKTEDAARRLHQLLTVGVTPPPMLRPRCRGCSLHDYCLPELLPDRRALQNYQQALFNPTPDQ